MQVIKGEGSFPIKAWTDTIEDSALVQLKNLARMPFIAKNGVAVMPDVHAGIGATVGSAPRPPYDCDPDSVADQAIDAPLGADACLVGHRAVTPRSSRYVLVRIQPAPRARAIVACNPLIHYNKGVSAKDDHR